MAIKFERIKAGDTLYDRHRTRMDNTTMSRLGEWPVHIISIDYEKDEAVASWNHNRPETWRRYRLERLYRSSMYGKPKTASK